MEKLEVTGYSLENEFAVLDASGMHAFMILTQLLWNNKIGTDIAKVKYDTTKRTITITTKQFKYEFTNVPLQWGGTIDTHQVYANHIQELKESEVI